MPTTYLGRLILTPDEFAVQQTDGWSNSDSTYDDYLRMIRSQVVLAVRDRALLAMRGIEVRAPEFERSPEMQAILDEVRVELAEQRHVADLEVELTALAA